MQLVSPRRDLLGACLLGLAAGPRAGRAQAADDPARAARPRRGDRLVFFGSDRAGQRITPADVKANEGQVLAWAFDVQRNVARDGSMLNLVLLVRCDPAAMSPEEAGRAAEGVLAFSAICTHQQCPVTEWLSHVRHLRCPCHQSEYDPAAGARVVGGPAPRPLPALPLMMDAGELAVAGPFTARVGGEKPGMG